jgi:site-specific DNA-methyltransferase (adenine-specific)
VRLPIREGVRKYVYHEEPGVVLLHGDCREVLAALGPESVQCVVTSPPYWGLRDYGVGGQIGLEASLDAYLAEMGVVFEGVRRALRGDGTLWLNMGDAYAKGTNSVKSFRRDKASVSVPGRRPSGCLKPKDLIGLPWRVAFGLQAAGWWLREDIIWHKPNAMPESVQDRPTRAHEYIFLMSRAERYYYDADSVGSYHRDGRGKGEQGRASAQDYKGRNKRSVWTISSQAYPGAHFATFPPKLVEPCIIAGTREGDVVLDPFSGSGTVGMVCKRLGRKYIGIELNEEYLRLSLDRIGTQMVLV